MYTEPKWFYHSIAKLKNMITEDLGVHLRTSLGPLIGIKEIEILEPDEYTTREDPPDWYDTTAQPPEMILYLELSVEPQKHIIKRISDIVHHSRTQIHYIENRDGSNHVYFCPTTNEFTAIYSVAPANPKRLFQ